MATITKIFQTTTTGLVDLGAAVGGTKWRSVRLTACIGSGTLDATLDVYETTGARYLCREQPVKYNSAEGLLLILDNEILVGTNKLQIRGSAAVIHVNATFIDEDVDA